MCPNVLGTYPFFSPEACAGAFDAVVGDYWAAAVTLFALLFGELPWYERQVCGY